VEPGSARFFQPCVKHVTMPRFDQTRADRQAEFQSSGVIQTIQAVGEVAMGCAHRCRFIRDLIGFQMLC
jgi:hypothetical protein